MFTLFSNDAFACVKIKFVIMLKSGIETRRVAPKLCPVTDSGDFIMVISLSA
jgi:hypothetical protein